MKKTSKKSKTSKKVAELLEVYRYVMVFFLAIVAFSVYLLVTVKS